MLRGRALVPVGLIASLAGCGGGIATIARVSRQRAPVLCDSLLQRRTFDARPVLGLPIAMAAARIKAHGCTPRTVQIDNQPLPIELDLSTDRVDLTVRGGFVTGVEVG